MPDFLQNLLDRVGGLRQALIIGVGVLVTAAVYGVSQYASRPVMVSLISDVPAASVGKMIAKLTELGIGYQLGDGGNAILVDSSAVARARVELSSAGLVDVGRPGLEMFDKINWGATDFTQKVNFRRAMEGELVRNISRMTDVKFVQVSLALEDDQIFKQNERPAKAAVTLAMTTGETPPERTVRGIQRLVASSVGGLSPDNVTIVDERGQALTLDEPNSVTGLASRQLEQQREVEKELKSKIEPLLVASYGAGNSKVEVTAELNFDRIERNTQSIDPDKQALTSEAKQEVTPSAPTQGAAFNNSTTIYDYTRATESFVASVGGIKKLTVAVAIADEETIPPVDTAAAAKGAPPAAPIITPRTRAELARVDSLVRRAIGVDSARGDEMTVTSMRFIRHAPPVVADTLPTPTLVNRVLANPKPVVAIASLVVVLAVAVLVLGALKQKKPKLDAATQAAMNTAPGYAELPASSQMNDAMQHTLQSGQQHSENGMNSLDGSDINEDGSGQIDHRRLVKLPDAVITEEREQAMAMVAQRPEAAIRVSKSLLRTDR